VKEGALADLLLLNPQEPALVPHFNLASDLIYAANGSCVDTLICDGKVLMRRRKVEGEEEVIEEARRVAHDLLRR